ncbi:MAG TPA: hypothetical protein VML75_29415 [Kofleriaceae bacterium]|nr:hypothetical protein [Kofleriaceae bacterium]
MFRAIAVTQWKWTRGIVLLTTIMGFALPLLVLQFARRGAHPQEFVAIMQSWAPAYAILSALTGLLVGLMAWQHDHQGRHVYALSLPIPRSRYVLLRFGSGLLFLVPTMVAVLVSALIVSASSQIPDALQAYPLAFAFRFALAAVVAYTMFFAVASSTSQTAGVIIGVIVALVFTQYLLSITSTDVDILSPVVDFLFARPGILSIFSGRWMLVDV